MIIFSVDLVRKARICIYINTSPNVNISCEFLWFFQCQKLWDPMKNQVLPLQVCYCYFWCFCVSQNDFMFYTYVVFSFIAKNISDTDDGHCISGWSNFELEKIVNCKFLWLIFLQDSIRQGLSVTMRGLGHIT